MNLKPLFDRVVVLPNKSEQASVAGLVLPERSLGAPQTGKVISVGANVERVQAGDNVLFNRFSGVEFVINGENHLVLKEIDIVGVIND